MALTWDKLRSKLDISEEDEAAIELEKDIIRTMIKLREEKGLNQSELAKM